MKKIFFLTKKIGDVILIQTQYPNKTGRGIMACCGELMCVAHVALIDLGWIYVQTQEVLQGLTAPVPMRDGLPGNIVALHLSILSKYSTNACWLDH